MGGFQYYKYKLYRLILGKSIEIGVGTDISRNVTISTAHGGTIKIGTNCQIGDYSMLLTYGGHISIGNDCSINPFCILYGHGGLNIGNMVRIAAHTVIIPANHSFEDFDVPIMYQPESRKGINIGNDVWIGSGVRLLDGITIGRGSVVAAGSVVTKSVPDFSVVAGVPARVIKSRERV